VNATSYRSRRRSSQCVRHRLADRLHFVEPVVSPDCYGQRPRRPANGLFPGSGGGLFCGRAHCPRWLLLQLGAFIDHGLLSKTGFLRRWATSHYSRQITIIVNVPATVPLSSRSSARGCQTVDHDWRSHRGTPSFHCGNISQRFHTIKLAPLLSEKLKPDSPYCRRNLLTPPASGELFNL